MFYLEIVINSNYGDFIFNDYLNLNEKTMAVREEDKYLMLRVIDDHFKYLIETMKANNDIVNIDEIKTKFITAYTCRINNLRDFVCENHTTYKESTIGCSYDKYSISYLVKYFWEPEYLDEEYIRKNIRESGYLPEEQDLYNEKGEISSILDRVLEIEPRTYDSGIFHRDLYM